MFHTVRVARTLEGALLVCILFANMACSDNRSQKQSNLSSEQRRNVAREQLRLCLEKFVRDGDRKSAKEELQRLVREDPNFVEAQYDLGRLEEADENWADAIRSFRECQRIAPDVKAGQDAVLHLRWLETVQERSKTAVGAQALKYEMLVDGSRSLIQAHEYRQAQAIAQKAIQLDSSSYEAYSVAAAALSRLGQYDTGLAALRTAISKAPADKRPALERALEEMSNEAASEQHRVKATKALTDGRYSEAAAEFEAAWKVRPAFEGYGLRAAIAYQLADSKDDAVKILQKLSASNDLKVAQFAASQLAKLEMLATPAEKESEIAQQTQSEAEKLAVINDPDGYTNIRNGPSRDATIIGRVTRGEQFMVTPSSDDWWSVRTYEGVNGYMRSTLIKILSDEEASSKDGEDE